MDLLKSFLIFICVVLPLLAKAELVQIKSFEVSCTGSEQKCNDFKDDIEKKINIGLYRDSLKDYFNLLLFDSSISRFSYEVNQDLLLNINISFFKKISYFQINHNTNIETKTLERLVGLAEGSFFKEASIEKAKEQVVNYFIERGYSNTTLAVSLSEADSRVKIDFNVNTGSFIRVKNVKIVSESDEESVELIKRRFHKFQNKVWNKIDIKFEIERLSADLFSQGYFSSNVKTLSPKFVGNNLVSLRIKVDLGNKHSFSFHGSKVFNHQELLNKLKEEIKTNLGYFKEDDLVNLVIKMYEDAGIFNTEVTTYKNLGTDSTGQSFINYFFTIKEGNKVVLNSLSFAGNLDFSLQSIKEIYFNEASVLIERGFLDLKYVDEFSEILRKKYLEEGYVQVDISKPRVTFNENRTRVDVEYRIKERQQVKVKKIAFSGVPLIFREEIRRTLENKKNEPLNVLEVDKDLEKTIKFLKDRGYYFAFSDKLKSDEILKYDPNFTSAEILIAVRLGDKVSYNNSLVSGYSKTKKKVIDREIEFKKGELLTPEKVQKLKNRLSSLGIFSSIVIRPLLDKDTKNYNLLVQVQEKDFGTAFFAPGYRTDLGYKVSTGTNYNNINGMNRIGSLRAQVNRRTSYSSFDSRRQQEQKNMVEFSFRGNLTEPYFVPRVFGRRMEGDLGFSVERKRYYEFDADRFRVAPSLSKSFSDYFSASLKYQFERINQFDATSAINNDDFNIGGITPGISFDFRDDQVSPRKGSFFSLSVEFANPFFGSMDNESIKVNYYKLVSRNRFYFPYKDFVFALSVAWGIQKNFANNAKLDASGDPELDENGDISTEGYIPSIKVFRLNGVDIVRGFAEDEINVLSGGQDIGDVIIRDSAYFTNLKFETRYSVSDTFVFGPFFDAGRVFVDSFKPLDLRTSIGLSLKYVTPVGTLDFDYGVKLKRETHNGLNRESYGRFHLSIGFF